MNSLFIYEILNPIAGLLSPCNIRVGEDMSEITHNPKTCKLFTYNCLVQ